ncbi:CRISPR-associated protein, TM1802 family [Thermoanaerobacter italicus Ab9]|uniref:CRISPR-associated protein, TM1802 family n=2 Tax=Thermoanaerobacter TaxID=1754 RepID=D3T6A2_THEIA|nr:MULTISPECIES: TIGR02556 family CRISPR-associated protein [Thermoanaerobacter]ADD03496.1 CRISPR-associated protein, TM1802 family [Thermoanaerobacter italicus Ab9]MDP9750249.1 CRISPR-associated protein Csh1 [Thermoanaerobacter pentosaceus]
MITAIKELGEMVLKSQNKTLLDVLIENPNQEGRYSKIATIDFTIKEDDIEYEKVRLEEYDDSKINRYLFTDTSGNAPGYTPAAKITEVTKTFNGKIKSWFKVLDDRTIKIDQKNKTFLQNIRNILEEKSDEIIAEVEKIRKDIPKREGLSLILKFNVDGDSKYIGDLDIFKSILLQLHNKKYQKIHSKDKVCSICGQKKKMIFGTVDTYKFYTIDKPGYIAGGFNEKESWRNYPVCKECMLALEEGKRYLENELTFKFYGLEYQLIPNFIIGNEFVKKEVREIFENASKLISLKKETKKRFIGDEDEILDYLAKAEDTMTVNFLFLKKANSAERILLLIEDVFPSHLREIFNAKDKVDETFNENFTFKNIRSFMSKSDSNKKDNDLDTYFLDITDRIFTGRPVDLGFLYGLIMKKVREEFVNDRNYKNAIKDGLMTVAFLEKLKLIKMEVVPMEERIFDSFFAKYGPSFETPLKKGLVLLGALTELLLRKQYSDREAKPFMKNLKGLKMDEKDIKGLLPKVQNKLEEYDSFDKGKRLLAKEVSNYLLLAGDNWNMSVDEINFYFVCGINLADELTNIIYKKEEEEKTNGKHC